MGIAYNRLINQKIIAEPTRGRILIGINQQQHPVGIRMGRQRLTGSCIETDIPVVYGCLTGDDVVTAGGVSVVETAVAIIIPVGGVAGGITIFDCNGCPVFKAAVYRDGGAAFSSGSGRTPL